MLLKILLYTEARVQDFGKGGEEILVKQRFIYDEWT